MDIADHICGYCGKNALDHPEPCMLDHPKYGPNPHPYLGPSSDFGWARCHGCEHSSDAWGYAPPDYHPDEEYGHGEGCTRTCVREICLPHKGFKDSTNGAT